MIANFTNLEGSPAAITDNIYGKGHAIYLATPADIPILGPLVNSLYGPLGIEKGPDTPDGVYARVVERRTLYVNSTGQSQRVPIAGEKQGLLTGRHYRDSLTLPPYQVDLLQ